MGTVIRSLMVKVGADLTDMQKGLKQASKDLKNVGKSLSSAGSTLTKGLTVPIVGAVAGLTGLATKAAATADDLNTLSASTGISTDTLQKLQYASKFVDVSMEDMQKGMAKVVMGMKTASDSGEDYIAMSGGLSVSMKDANGNLKSSEQMFYDTIDALGSMTDSTQREIAAQDIFGKSYQDIMPLIKAGSGALQEYGNEAENLGIVMGKDTLNSLNGFNDTLDKLKSVVAASGAQIGAAFLPVIEKITPIIAEKVVPAIAGFAEKIAKLIDWFSALDPKTQKIIGIIGLLVVAIGPALSIVGKMTTGIGGLIGGVSKAIGIISGGGGIISALSAIISPAGLVIAAVAAIAAAALLIYKNWDGISAFFKKLWDGVLGFFEKAVNKIIKLINKIPGVHIDEVDWTSDTSSTATTSTSKKTASVPINKKGSLAATYAVGTNYVPQTGYALLHQGEAVIPASMNKGYAGAEITINNPLYLDGQIINRSNSRVQYGKNRAKARSLGVTT